MGHTQQLCGWDIAYKWLGPPGTIHIVGYIKEPSRQMIGIFASNTYGISGGHPRELLQKHRNVITPEYPYRPCIDISGDLHCVADDRIEAPSWIGSDVLQGSTGLWCNAFPTSIFFTQNFLRSNAVHTLPQPTFSPSGTPSSIGEVGW